MPGPWVKYASTCTPWCSCANCGCCIATLLKATEIGSAASPRNGNSAICVQHEAARRVAVHGERDVGQAVLHGVEGARRRRRRARGRMLHLTLPSEFFSTRSHHSFCATRQRVRGRHPAGRGEHGLRDGRRARDGGGQGGARTTAGDSWAGSLWACGTTVRRGLRASGPDLPARRARVACALSGRAVANQAAPRSVPAL